MRTRIVWLCLWLVTGLMAQEHRPWEQYLNEVMTAEDAGSTAWEQTYELLCELEQHPLNINHATREQLEELPFLSAQQVEGIMAYLWRYGRMESLGELTMIRELDYPQRRLLTYFIYVDEQETENDRQQAPSLKNIAQYGHHELMATGRLPFYDRKGDINGYLGPKYRHWLRYQFTYNEQVKAGVVGAQDAGEPFFANRNRWGYDYYSVYAQLRNIGRVESLVVGHYRVSMGMGLVMNNSFSLGKLAILQNLGRSAYTLRAHSSRSVGSLLGAATTVDVGSGLKLTTFASYSPVDATLNQDGTAATILDTDYHRTETEMGKKHNLHLLKTGGSLRYHGRGLRLGVNILYTHLDRTLHPNTSPLYRRHYPQGSDFLNLSLDYGYATPRWSLCGETATDRKGHLATINSVSLRLSEMMSLMVLQRFYSYAYTSLDAQSFSDGGKVQNESGIYLGWTWQPSQTLRLNAYTDYAYFAWARYQVSQSSYSWDNLLQATWQKQNWTLNGRYRVRLRQKDSEDKKTLENQLEHRGRLGIDYAGGHGLTGRLQMDGCRVQEAWGVMISGSLSWTRQWLRLSGGAGYFHTGSYDSRLYLYENSPLYTYSMAQFYGEGIRYWLMARAGIGKRLILTVKMGVTDYFDRNVIGSSYQQVDGSSLTDLDLQVRWKI